jgi:hypothetical protein
MGTLRRDLTFQGIIQPLLTLYRRDVVRVMYPRPPDDSLCGPGRRVRSHRRRVHSPRRGTSEVNVMLGPERPRHIVEEMTSGPARSRGPSGPTAHAVPQPIRSSGSRGMISKYGPSNPSRRYGFSGYIT